jgi:cytochrome c
MFTTTKYVAGVAASVLLSSTVLAADSASPAFGFGVVAPPSELAAFFSPLPDGRGLPAGSGSVAQGKAVYQQQCLACHGQNLEGGIGDRLIGGRGSLVNADPSKAPIKTVESYWPYATTLFDYVKRTMPFTAPNSLTNDQVYAVVAYILSEAKIVPSDAVLDAKKLALVEMPNRAGFISDRRPETFPPASKAPHQIKTMSAPSK